VGAETPVSGVLKPTVKVPFGNVGVPAGPLLVGALELAVVLLLAGVLELALEAPAAGALELAVVAPAAGALELAVVLALLPLDELHAASTATEATAAKLALSLDLLIPMCPFNM
jgi:hypothetical protein